MTGASPVASTAVLRQIAALGVLGGFARVIIIVRYPPFAEEPGLLVVLHKLTGKGLMPTATLRPLDGAELVRMPCGHGRA